jgi:hypothetical protein
MEINQEAFASAIRKQYAGFSETVAAEYAARWTAQLNPQLHGALLQWIHNEPIEDVCVGEFSIKEIVNIRADGDYLKAILLLSEYMSDPRKGKAQIMRPRR